MEKKPKANNIPRIRTGCTLLDLVVGGGEGLGWPPGKIVNIVGDKSTGKTFVACEIVAANYHAYKKKFRFNYDDGESGFTFNTRHLYGIDMLKKDTLRSDGVEDFDVNAQRFLNKMEPEELGLYILDTLDGLSNADVEKRAEERLKAADKGKEFEDNTYGVLTPKFLSQEFFRNKTHQFEDKKALLIIVSQVRENLKAGMFSKKLIRAGGKAMDFFAHTCLWLYSVDKIIVKGRPIGVVLRAKADKSKTARPYRECIFSVYFDYGLDNIGSNLDFLFDLRSKDGSLLAKADSISWSGEEINLTNLRKFLSEQGLLERAREEKKKDDGKPQLSISWLEEWISKVDKEKYKASYLDSFGLPESREDLIKRIEEDPDLEKELERRVIEKWEAIEESIRPDRKRKYV
jgi:RecA/RadA recombinase